MLARRVLRGVMLSAPGQDEPVVVTTPGDVVWDLLAHPVDEAELVRQVAARFDEDPGVIQRDVAALVDRLVDLGAVERCG